MSKDPAEPPGLDGVVLASGLVAFQSGTVVSRTLVRKPAGTVTVFAFDAGEGPSQHTAPFDALAINPHRSGSASQASCPRAACGEGNHPVQDASRHD